MRPFKLYLIADAARLERQGEEILNKIQRAR